MFIAYVIMAMSSLVLGMLVIHPSLNAEGKKSNIYFGHIANKSKEQFLDEINNQTEYSYSDDLDVQIFINSNLSRKKYVYTSWAIKLTFISIMLLIFYTGSYSVIGGV